MEGAAEGGEGKVGNVEGKVEGPSELSVGDCVTSGVEPDAGG